MSRDVVISELIKQETRQLKVPAAARDFEALGRQAREEKWSFEDYLHEVLSIEIASRRESAVRLRIATHTSPRPRRSTSSPSPPPKASMRRRLPTSHTASLLILDEVEVVPFDRIGGELLLKVVASRSGGSVLVRRIHRIRAPSDRARDRATWRGGHAQRRRAPWSLVCGRA